MPNGADPVEVIIPDFTVRKVAQDSPVVRSTNLVFVTLTTNADLEGAAQSYIDVQVTSTL